MRIRVDGMGQQTLIATSEVDDGWVKTTCPYCGVGCGVEARLDSEQRLEVRGDQTHPANFGRLCSKGLALAETVVPDGRLLYPQVGGQRVSWPDVLQQVSEQLVNILAEHGPDAIAFYVSGQLLTEDYYVANKLMKGFIGSGNIDTNSRLCMSSSVAGHKRAFGSDTVPGCYSDLEMADLVVLTGSNLAWCHPVLFQRLKAAKQQRPHMKIVVVDPRRTDTCELADLHLAIAPGTDVALFNGLLAHLAKHGRVDEDFVQSHTEGFTDALMTALEDGGNVHRLSRALGVEDYELETFFAWFADTEKTVTVYSQGVNQSSAGTDKVNSILNCHLATARIGKPGCGPFSITGQPNAMGGREVGGLANTLAAHMEFDNEEQQALVGRFWGTDRLAAKPGLKAVDMFEAVDRGDIKAVWIMATNPVMSLPDADRVRRALEKCPLVIVSDCIADTDTTRLADILLPATGWAEKSGTVTNSERRISRQRALLPAAGEARPDWWIISQVARRMGFTATFDYSSEADIFREYAALTGLDNDGKRDLDLGYFGDISTEDYQRLQPVQWPAPRNRHLTQASKRFFGDGVFFTPSGRGRFVAVSHRPPCSAPDAQYPLVLNSGRIRDQWHSMTRTGLSPRLSGHLPQPFVTVNPRDATRYRLRDGALADVTSATGAVRVRVQVSAQCAPGQLFMPMHWNDVHASSARVCSLIAPHRDPISGQPENKYTPVSIAPWSGKSEAVLILRERLQAVPGDYWAVQRVSGGYLYVLESAADPTALAASLRDLLLGQSDEGVQQLEFGDPGKGEFRYARVRANELVAGYALAPRFGNRDFSWLGQLLDMPFDPECMGALFRGQPGARLAGGRTVCACKQVGYNTLCQAIRDQGLDSVAALSAATAAGTGCGSCLPELGAILAAETAEAHAA